MNEHIEKPQNQAASTSMLNKLRAAVLGANDGIVSTASVLMGVAGATDSTGAIFTAGLAALVAGALSMAVGEYVSVGSQSDAEKAFIQREKALIEAHPEEEKAELAEAYIEKGVSEATAHKMAAELMAKDPIGAHLEIHGMGAEDDVVSPMQAAIASFLSFTAGGLVPFLAMGAPKEIRIWVTYAAVTLALALAGYLSAHAGGAPRGRAMARVIIGGLLAMAITYYVGKFFGTAIA